MSQKIRLDDDGYVEIELYGPAESAGNAGPLAVVTVDLFEAINALGEAYDAHRTGRARLAAYVEVFQELGFPPLSHKAADRLYARLLETAGLAGNVPTGEPTPGSPASTTLTPGDSLPDSV